MHRIMKHREKTSEWLIRLILVMGTGLLLNGCVATTSGPSIWQQANDAYPGVAFKKPAPIQVNYTGERELVFKEVLAVLTELDEKIDTVDKKGFVITTKARKYAQLVNGKQAATSYIYRSTIKLTVVDKGTGVAMETLFSKAKGGSGQFASGSKIVRQLFFHQLNSSLTPQLFTFRDGGQTYTKSAAEVLNLKGIEYVVKRNETLSIIAGRYTGNAGNWKEIAAFNGIKNPKNVIAGQIILLPVNLLTDYYRKNGIVDKLRPVRKKKAKTVKPQKRKEPLCGERGADCFMHRVAGNETLTGITALYTGDLKNLSNIAADNHISDSGSLLADQAVFIRKLLLTGDVVSNTHRLTFLTGYPKDQKVMRQAVSNAFKEFGITTLRSDSAHITSTVWRRDGIQFNFSITLHKKGEATDVAILCYVAPETGQGAVGARGQQWIEESLFPAIDKAIKDVSATENGVNNNGVNKETRP